MRTCLMRTCSLYLCAASPAVAGLYWKRLLSALAPNRRWKLLLREQAALRPVMCVVSCVVLCMVSLRLARGDFDCALNMQNFFQISSNFFVLPLVSIYEVNPCGYTVRLYAYTCRTCCMHLYVAHVRRCMPAHVYVCVQTYTHTYGTHTHTSCAYIRRHTLRCMHTYTYGVRIHTQTYTYIVGIHTQTYTYNLRRYTHTYTVHVCRHTHTYVVRILIHTRPRPKHTHTYTLHIRIHTSRYVHTYNTTSAYIRIHTRCIVCIHTHTYEANVCIHTRHIHKHTKHTYVDIRYVSYVDIRNRILIHT